MATLTFNTATKQRRVRKWNVRRALNFYNDGAVTTSTRFQWVVNADYKILGVVGYAGAVGSGTGSTQIDIRKNGTSIFVSSERFNLAAADNGIFNGATMKTDTATQLRPGDVVSLHVTAIPSTAGHSQVAFSILLG
jgi:hypothetical protein